MAGVVAMASVIADFDTQPCKKSRKDDGGPVVETIANSLSPVARPMKKLFFPPRSNNIMEYFSKKAPSSKEKTSSPEQFKENCHWSHAAEKDSHTDGRKRGRKANKVTRKLVTGEAVNSNKDVVEAFSSQQKTVLHAELSAEASIITGILESNVTTTIRDEWTEKEKDGAICADSVKFKSVLMNTNEVSTIEFSRDEAKPVETSAKNDWKRQQPEANYSDPDGNEVDCTLGDASIEVNMDEISALNSSTVTISFEDFVRSQDKIEEDTTEGQIKNETTVPTGAEKMEQSNNLKSEENVKSSNSSIQVSPRTVTIQAEVHVVSPKSEAVKTVGKVASIFNHRKRRENPAGLVASFHTEAGHQHPSHSLTVKRKSNVVLQEEDLELAVLEIDSTSKCSESQRKQFMAAFKQPSHDGYKTKPVKSQGKQKHFSEKILDSSEKNAGDNVNPPSAEQVSQAHQGNKTVQMKPARASRNKAKEQKKAVTTSPAPAVVEEPVIFEDDDKSEEPTSSITGARRSIRKAVVRQSPETIPSPVRKNTKLNETMRHPVASSLPQDSTIKMSTSKILKAKHGVFVAEMLCSPDTEKSPIRIKFTRVQKNVSISKAESGMKSSKESLFSEAKKNKRVKRLVEKAKRIQQSKKTSVDEKCTLRRSSHTEASMKRNCCEDENSVICAEEDWKNATPQKAPEKGRTQKPLRNLNVILGKPTQASKDTNTVPGSKVVLLGQSGSEMVSIVNERSYKGSKKSQDEQFEARIKFLKSGLPESFKKQLAKTIVSREAYFLSCSAFQPVTHTTQLPNDRSLWPESLLLCHLKELWSQTFNPLQPTVIGSLCVKTVPACRRISERCTGWKWEISDRVRQLLMEETSTSNPHFNAHQFIARFLKRRTDHQQQFTASEPAIGATSTLLPAEPVRGKRKRREDERENTVKVAKKPRASHSVENISISDLEPKKRGGHMGQLQRSMPQQAGMKEKYKPAITSVPIPSKDDVVILTDLLLKEDIDNKDVFKEDVLWTDKYQPQHSSDIIGNTASVRRLHSWLKEWKLRADQEERRRQKNKKTEECSVDSDWEEDSQNGDDMLCNTVLICGPTGVGKTAAVYACAQELGFKVFEVNASSQRSGRLILSQLKEATQSHQVDSQGVSVSKPTYFNSYGINSSPGIARPQSSPRKVNSPHRVVSSPRKHPQLPKGVKGGSPTPTSLANYFKMGHAIKKEPSNTSKNEQMGASNKVIKANKSGSTQHSEEPSKKIATSLILFEEVDVIFDGDSGFLTAIKTFMTTTKRPVILTTTDPSFSSVFDGTFEEIHFKTPSVLNVCSYLQLLCLAEDLRTDPSDVSSLLRLNGCDIRQSLLQLQFWGRSAGGCHTARPLVQTGKNAGDKSPTTLFTLPPCDTGCTESMLGLLNIEPERDIWELLQSQSLVREPICLELLADCRRQGVDILYSNMEILLPVPVTQLSTSASKPKHCVSASQRQLSVDPAEQPQSILLQSSHARLLHTAELADSSNIGSPFQVSSRMPKNKRQCSIPDEDGLQSDSEDEFISFCSLQGTLQAKEEFEESLVLERVKKKAFTNEKHVKTLAVSQCLESIGDFLDNLSYMDSSLLSHPGVDYSHRRMVPVSAVIKDGMTDETRVETDRGRWLILTGDRVLEIQAAVEVLSFHKCSASVGESWDKVQQLEGELGREAVAELSLPVATHQKGYSFTQDGPCQPQLVWKRREVMESLMWTGVFGTIGYRPAAAVDYLPIIRTICRSEQLKEQGKVKRRFLHYLDAVHLGLDKSALQLLAEDFR